ncbi:hypothetical protein [Dyella sp.]|uniref:hypothetical protein n=1 Tax=Dyella sp. TaxID=1869338 RepID=UPI00283FA8A5|nr:hypothetical protein [Dyella sp.]MDR3447594.1 hypothetical protein [Dyella sp.]
MGDQKDGALMLPLTLMADMAIHTRPITSIYLPEGEFAALAATLICEESTA